MIDNFDPTSKGVFTTLSGEIVAKQRIFFSVNEWEFLLSLSTIAKQPIGNLLMSLAIQERRKLL